MRYQDGFRLYLTIDYAIARDKLIEMHILTDDPIVEPTDDYWNSFKPRDNSNQYINADLYERQFITVNPKNTTQTCHDCGFVIGNNETEKLTLADREWTCPRCHTHHIRDYNAALNILEKGFQK